MHPPSATRAPVILHTVTPSDEGFCYELARDPTVRAQSLDPAVPDYTTHHAWFTAFLTDKQRHGWIVLYQHEKAAFVRLDHISRLGAKIHVAVAPAFRGKGIATAAIYHATLFAQNEDWGVMASIKPDNVASIRAFEKCGYVKVGPGIEAGQEVVVYAIG